MTPQERDLITALLGRLQQQTNQSKDAEAEALIRGGMTAQPDAPYLLVQTVLIQDMALAEAHRRIKELQDAKPAATPAPAPSSFLGNASRGSVPAAGPWGPAPSAQPPQPAAAGPVWTQSGAAQAAPAYPSQPMVAPLAAPGASSGFLRQAATTAAGVAGGALLFQGIQSLFGPHYGAGFLGGMPMQPGLGETVINNHDMSPDQTAADVTPADPNFDPGAGADPGVIQADDSQDYGNQDVGPDQDFGSGGGDGGSFDV